MEEKMPAELATMPKETRLAQQPAPEYSNEQIRLLAETIAKDCDQDELAFFLQVAKLKKLDPFTGQIHVVKRWDSSLGKKKMTVQVGIDGFRVIASRTNDLAGIDDPEYDTEEEEHPNIARVTVYRYGRNDERIPYRATARWTEYAQTIKEGALGPMWKKSPYLMLGKCAEALALRKAFPDELSGMYTNEEMDQADNEVSAQQHSGKRLAVTQPTRASEKPATAQQATHAQPEKGKLVETSGVIENAKPGNNGMLWLTLKGHQLLVCVPEAKIDGDMSAGSFIKFRGAIFNHKSIGDYWQLDGLVELQKVQEGEIATPASETTESKSEMAPDARAAAEDLEKIEQGQGGQDLKGMFDSGAVKKGSDIPQGSSKKPGTIGIRKAQRLYTLMSQNKKSNNGFNEEECKKILSALPAAIEHLRDLEEGMMGQFEKWATGEEDFRDFWKE